jgi:hypothetical protein
MSTMAATMATLLSPARAAASRHNGAKSRGPKTAEGKARSARNALKHGLCAQRYVVLGDEDLAEFDALEAALTAELAPQGALQAVLVRRIVAATWRLERAERMEAEVFAQNISGTTSFGLAMIRDCNGARAFDTLLRYRGTTLAELWRSLRTLKALQAEQAARPDEPPIEPEARTIPGEFAALPPAHEAESLPSLNGAEAAALDPAEPREAPPVSAPQESDRTQNPQESWQNALCNQPSASYAEPRAAYRGG